MHISFQTECEPAANHWVRILSPNNQIQNIASAPIVNTGRPLPAPVHSGDEELNPGEDNGNVQFVLHSTSVQHLSQQPSSMPGWIALTKPSLQVEKHVITLRRETHVTLDIDLEQISRQPSAVCNGIKIPATGSVKNYADTSGKSLLEFRINLYGATTKRRYENICANCEKREGKKKGNPSPIDFKAESEMIAPKDGKIRVEFVFCCYPKHHLLGDSEYL
jgi:hypothetical protein